MRIIIVLALAGALAGRAAAQVTRTSANSMIIDAGAAPACGRQGAAEVAAKAAAIETIKAGFERYIIVGAQAQSNITTSQLPGTYHTSGTARSYGGYGTFSATTTYRPGATIVSGSHDRSLSVVMFKPGDPDFEQAIDARQTLGPDWEEKVKSGVHTCF